MKLLKFPVCRLLMGWLALAAIGVKSQTVVAQEETFYYRKGEKVPLKVDATKTFVLFSPETTRGNVEKATKSAKAVLQRFDSVKVPTGLNLTQEPLAKGAKWAIIDNIDVAAQPLDQAELAENVLYKAPFFLTKDKKQVGMSHLVYVKLKEPGDKAKLEALAKELKVVVVSNNRQMPLWYTLACTKDSAGNALQVANKLYESNNFAAAEPDFLADFQIRHADEPAKCVDDAHFGNQWELKNTGQNGGTASIDIGVCDRPAEAHPAKPEEEDELILEREPDGRYRVVGRRPRKKVSKGTGMASTHQGPKPDETDSKAVGRRPEPQDQPEARHEVTKADAGEATATYRPAEAHPAKPEEEDELILEREPDGRYRVVGRRPRKKE